MANIVLELSVTGEQVPVELDLNLVTSMELLFSAFKEVEEWRIYNADNFRIRKESQILSGTATLASLGVINEDTLKLYLYPVFPFRTKIQNTPNPCVLENIKNKV